MKDYKDTVARISKEYDKNVLDYAIRSATMEGLLDILAGKKKPQEIPGVIDLSKSPKALIGLSWRETLKLKDAQRQIARNLYRISPRNNNIALVRRDLWGLIRDSNKVLDKYYKFMKQRKINHLILSGLTGMGAGLLGYGASKIYNISRHAQEV